MKSFIYWMQINFITKKSYSTILIHGTRDQFERRRKRVDRDRMYICIDSQITNVSFQLQQTAFFVL